RTRGRPCLPDEGRRVRRGADPHVDRLQARDGGRHRAPAAPSRRVRVVLRLLGELLRISPSSELGVTVRDVRGEDWPAVRAIYLDGIRSGLASFETEAPSWEDWDAAHTLRLVADWNDEVIGWVAAGPVSPRRCYRGVLESSIYIAADARNLG